MVQTKPINFAEEALKSPQSIDVPGYVSPQSKNETPNLNPSHAVAEKPYQNLGTYLTPQAQPQAPAVTPPSALPQAPQEQTARKKNRDRLKQYLDPTPRAANLLQYVLPSEEEEKPEKLSPQAQEKAQESADMLRSSNDMTRRFEKEFYDISGERWTHRFANEYFSMGERIKYGLAAMAGTPFGLSDEELEDLHAKNDRAIKMSASAYGVDGDKVFGDFFLKFAAGLAHTLTVFLPGGAARYALGAGRAFGAHLGSAFTSILGITSSKFLERNLDVRDVSVQLRIYSEAIGLTPLEVLPFKISTPIYDGILPQIIRQSAIQKTQVGKTVSRGFQKYLKGPASQIVDQGLGTRIGKVVGRSTVFGLSEGVTETTADFAEQLIDVTTRGDEFQPMRSFGAFVYGGLTGGTLGGMYAVAEARGGAKSESLEGQSDFAGSLVVDRLPMGPRKALPDNSRTVPQPPVDPEPQDSAEPQVTQIEPVGEAIVPTLPLEDSANYVDSQNQSTKDVAGEIQQVGLPTDRESLVDRMLSSSGYAPTPHNPSQPYGKSTPSQVVPFRPEFHVDGSHRTGDELKSGAEVSGIIVVPTPADKPGRWLPRKMATDDMGAADLVLFQPETTDDRTPLNDLVWWGSRGDAVNKEPNAHQRRYVLKNGQTEPEFEDTVFSVEDDLGIMQREKAQPPEPITDEEFNSIISSVPVERLLRTSDIAEVAEEFYQKNARQVDQGRVGAATQAIYELLNTVPRKMKENVKRYPLMYRQGTTEDLYRLGVSEAFPVLEIKRQKAILSKLRGKVLQTQGLWGLSTGPVKASDSDSDLQVQVQVQGGLGLNMARVDKETGVPNEQELVVLPGVKYEVVKATLSSEGPKVHTTVHLTLKPAARSGPGTPKVMRIHNAAETVSPKEATTSGTAQFKVLMRKLRTNQHRTILTEAGVNLNAPLLETRLGRPARLDELLSGQQISIASVIERSQTLRKLFKDRGTDIVEFRPAEPYTGFQYAIINPEKVLQEAEIKSTRTDAATHNRVFGTNLPNGVRLARPSGDVAETGISARFDPRPDVQNKLTIKAGHIRTEADLLITLDSFGVKKLTKEEVEMAYGRLIAQGAKVGEVRRANRKLARGISTRTPNRVLIGDSFGGESTVEPRPDGLAIHRITGEMAFLVASQGIEGKPGNRFEVRLIKRGPGSIQGWIDDDDLKSNYFIYEPREGYVGGPVHAGDYYMDYHNPGQGVQVWDGSSEPPVGALRLPRQFQPNAEAPRDWKPNDIGYTRYTNDGYMYPIRVAQAVNVGPKWKRTSESFIVSDRGQKIPTSKVFYIEQVPGRRFSASEHYIGEGEMLKFSSGQRSREPGKVSHLVPVVRIAPGGQARVSDMMDMNSNKMLSAGDSRLLPHMGPNQALLGTSRNLNAPCPPSPVPGGRK